VGPLAVAVARATTLLREHLDCGRVLYGDIQDGLTLVVDAGSSPDDVELAVGRWELGSWWPPEARAQFERGDPIVCDDVARDTRIPTETREAYADWGVASLVNVPVIEHGRVVAVVVVQDRVAREWTDEQLALVAQMAEELWRGERE
jgi:GAF domain-containing protein